MKKAVIDASVVLKWYLVDEELGDRALRLLEDQSEGRVSLCAPEHLRYELANGLVIAGRRGRLEAPEIVDALKGFWALQIEVVAARQISVKLPHLCAAYGISAYDASYAAAAQLLEAPLITADERLFQALKGAKGRVKRLADQESR